MIFVAHKFCKVQTRSKLYVSHALGVNETSYNSTTYVKHLLYRTIVRSDDNIIYGLQTASCPELHK